MMEHLRRGRLSFAASLLQCLRNRGKDLPPQNQSAILAHRRLGFAPLRQRVSSYERSLYCAGILWAANPISANPLGCLQVVPLVEDIVEKKVETWLKFEL